MSKSPADISSRPIIQPIIPYFSDIEYDPLKYGGCRNPVDIWMLWSLFIPDMYGVKLETSGLYICKYKIYH